MWYIISNLVLTNASVSNSLCISSGEGVKHMLKPHLGHFGLDEVKKSKDTQGYRLRTTHFIDCFKSIQKGENNECL